MQIETEFFPGAIGGVIKAHGEYYARHWGFGAFFETRVASELSAFAQRRSDTDLVLIARDDAGFAGSLIIDLNDPDSGDRGAHLRWFIMDDRCRGKGVGKDFVRRAMAHIDAHSGGASWLTTFAGLDKARALYETYGYRLTHEAEGEAWGTRVTEQVFQRKSMQPFHAPKRL